MTRITVTVGILRAALAIFVGLFMEFVALTFVSPLWESAGSRGEFVAALVIAAMLSFGCGCVIAVIAGPSAIPAFAIVSVFVTLGALATSENLLVGSIVMLELLGAAGTGMLVVRKSAQHGWRDSVSDAD